MSSSQPPTPLKPPESSSPVASEVVVWDFVKNGILAALGMLLLGIFFWLTVLSQAFELTESYLDRPIVETVVFFGIGSAVYLLAIVVACQARESKMLTISVLGFAVLFRLVVFFSTPIQEVDIYRYIWDGVVVAEGISPFRYPPQQVRQTTPEQASSDAHLLRLVQRYQRGNGDALALNQVHFAQVPTVYPPVSQVVFGLAAISCSPEASLQTRLQVMKLWLLLFDVGTVFLLLWMLRSLNLPTGYAVAYGWCPLVLKEIANSGHLDSIAIFFTTLAIWLFVRSILLPRWHVESKQPAVLESETTRQQIFRIGPILSVIALSLAIGAKIYAVVLAPLFCLVAIWKLGWKRSLLPAVIFVVTTLLVMWPMLPKPIAKQAGPQGQVAGAAQVDPSKGMEIFIKYWEMNDFLFMNTVENLKPSSNPNRKEVWFSFFPEKPRQRIVDFVNKRLGVEPNLAPFLTSRFLLTGLFIFIAGCIAAWACQRNNPADFYRAAFLTLAWFWLLAPTQNPWYWLWALPLIPFAKNRTWYLLSGLLFLYYLRFYFEYHCPDIAVVDKFSDMWGISWLAENDIIAGYKSVDFFDFVVTWIEYLPWFVLLLCETIFNLLFSRPKSPAQ